MPSNPANSIACHDSHSPRQHRNGLKLTIAARDGLIPSGKRVTWPGGHGATRCLYLKSTFMSNRFQDQSQHIYYPLKNEQPRLYLAGRRADLKQNCAVPPKFRLIIGKLYHEMIGLVQGILITVQRHCELRAYEHKWVHVLMYMSLAAVYADDQGGPFYWQGLIRINDIMPCKVWDEIAYPFANFNGCTVEVWEWISNLITHFTMDVNTYPCRD